MQGFYVLSHTKSIYTGCGGSYLVARSVHGFQSWFLSGGSCRGRRRSWRQNFMTSLSWISSLVKCMEWYKVASILSFFQIDGDIVRFSFFFDPPLVPKNWISIWYENWLKIKIKKKSAGYNKSHLCQEKTVLWVLIYLIIVSLWNLKIIRSSS